MEPVLRGAAIHAETRRLAIVAAMISYTDSIHGARLPRFEERSQELSDALQEIGSAAGDTVHTSGRADYVVRFFVNYADRTAPEPDAFVVVAEPEGISILTKVGDNDLTLVKDFAWEEPWFDGVIEKFHAFRELLDA